jgi:hypothetical protein
MTSRGRDPSETHIDNPLRDEQRHHIRDELEARLRHHGASLTGSESDDDIVTLSNAVELFERAVMQAGGDLMVDTPESSRPDHPDRVLPQRQGDEPVAAYVRRIHAAADAVGTVR